MNRKIFLLFALVLVLVGCGNKKEDKTEEYFTDPAVKEIFAMDTYMVLTAYGEHGQEAVNAAAKEIKRIDMLLSTGIEDSEISNINRQGSGNISVDTKQLIKCSEELYEKTGGLFDITIYPVMRAWGFADGNFRIPDEEELKKLLLNVGEDKIFIDETGKKISVEKDVEIDLGGIAKGYTSEQVMDIFREYGVASGVVSLGGNIQALGSKPDGSKWRVAIQKPDKEEEYVGVISVEDKAVITSGGYERYFEEGGELYHHIIDPRTGYPAKNGLTSVTIVNEDGTMADGLSTSLFIMGEEKAISFWQKNNSEFEMVLVNEDGEIFVSEGLKDCFESDYEFEIVEKER